MLNYSALGIKRKFMNTSNSITKYTQEYSEFLSILSQIFDQVSTFDNGMGVENSTTSFVDILLQCSSNCMKLCVDLEQVNKGSYFNVDDFSCRKCGEVLYHPITLQCGHTFCKCCMQETCVPNCIVCGVVIPQGKIQTCKTNTLLSTILEKCYPVETNGRALFACGMLHLNKGNCHEAIKHFTDSLLYVPNSHTALAYRAEAYLLLSDFNSARKDIQRVLQLASSWSQAHFIKAEICYKHLNVCDALLSYLTSYSLDPNKSVAKQRITSIVKKNFATYTHCTHQYKKRRFSQEFEAPPLPVKHAFHRCSIDSYTAADGCENLLDQEYQSVFDLRSSPTERSLAEANLSYSDSSFCGDQLSSNLERRLEGHLTAHFKKSLTCAKRATEVPRSRTHPLATDASDFECSLCFKLLYNPVTTPCGHTFCQYCLERSLDHTTKCPLCKQSVEEMLAALVDLSHLTCDHTTSTMIKRLFPKQHEERLQQHNEELEEMRQFQPIFVCTIAYPSLPCPLHVFEPRYRLMLRRCIEHNRRKFGMCLPEPAQPHSAIGTLLHVRNVTYFPDGRSVADCYGVHRFKTIASRMIDGYDAAKLMHIVDRKVLDPIVTEQLSTKVYTMASSWYNSLQPNLKVTISQHFGDFPSKEGSGNAENGPDWHWWILAVMPVEDRVKVTILGKDSFHERLLVMHRIFDCLFRRHEERQRDE